VKRALGVGVNSIEPAPGRVRIAPVHGSPASNAAGIADALSRMAGRPSTSATLIHPMRKAISSGHATISPGASRSLDEVEA